MKNTIYIIFTLINVCNACNYNLKYNFIAWSTKKLLIFTFILIKRRHLVIGIRLVEKTCFMFHTMKSVSGGVRKDLSCKHLFCHLPVYFGVCRIWSLVTIFLNLEALECVTCDADILFTVPSGTWSLNVTRMNHYVLFTTIRPEGVLALLAVWGY